MNKIPKTIIFGLLDTYYKSDSIHCAIHLHSPEHEIIMDGMHLIINKGEYGCWDCYLRGKLCPHHSMVGIVLIYKHLY